jgi:4-amino-4-deoxy-L-arabinose transferase-like glycosyltransferase
MSTTRPRPSSRPRWSLGRIVILLLVFAFAGLAVDLRMEHVDVVRQRTIGWTPIVYSALMALACLGAVIRWHRMARRILMALFALAFIVGSLGFYLHNNGNLARPPQLDLQAWTDPAMKHPKGPPPNAPLAFAGIGLLGIVACLERFNEPGTGGEGASEPRP